MIKRSQRASTYCTADAIRSQKRPDCGERPVQSASPRCLDPCADASKSHCHTLQINGSFFQNLTTYRQTRCIARTAPEVTPPHSEVRQLPRPISNAKYNHALWIAINRMGDSFVGVYALEVHGSHSSFCPYKMTISRSVVRIRSGPVERAVPSLEEG